MGMAGHQKYGHWGWLSRPQGWSGGGQTTHKDHGGGLATPNGQNVVASPLRVASATLIGQNGGGFDHHQGLSVSFNFFFIVLGHVAFIGDKTWHSISLGQWRY